MRFFYVALSETRRDVLERIFGVISDWNERTGRYGIRVGVLVRFSKWRRVCLPCRLAERYGVPVFVDNGAFDYLARGLESSIIDRWVFDYASWVRVWGNWITAYALPDVPVHEGPSFLGLEDRLGRIKLSARVHGVFAGRVGDSVLERGVVVLQGYALEEYEYSYELLSGIPELGGTQSFSGRGPYAGVFGVGSVCVRKASSNGKAALLAGGRAAGTLRGFLREFLGRCCPDIVGFHFFGLHKDAVGWFGRDARYFASDTGAHGFNFRYKWKSFLGCRELDPTCYARAVEHQLRITLLPLLRPTLEVVL